MLKLIIALWMLVFTFYSWGDSSAAEVYSKSVIKQCEKEAGRSTLVDFSINKNWTKNLNECLELKFLAVLRKYKANTRAIMTSGKDSCEKYLPIGEDVSMSLASSIERDWLKKTPNMEKAGTSNLLKEHISYYSQKALITQRILKQIKK